MLIQPTLHFRWQERRLGVAGISGVVPFPGAQYALVLQQGWAPIHGGQIEWRDVPVEPLAKQPD